MCLSNKCENLQYYGILGCSLSVLIERNVSVAYKLVWKIRSFKFLSRDWFIGTSLIEISLSRRPIERNNSRSELQNKRAERQKRGRGGNRIYISRECNIEYTSVAWFLSLRRRFCFTLVTLAIVFPFTNEYAVPLFALSLFFFFFFC